MNRYSIQSAFLGFAAVGLLWLAGARPANAQFTQNRETIQINQSDLPPEIHQAYRTFKAKCGMCHTLDTSLKPSLSAAQWTAVVKQMQAMASSHFNSREADQIAKFLAYDEIHRKAAAREAIGATSGSSPVAAGKQLFESYGCSSCHSVAGAGNTASALDGIGSKRTVEELKKLIVSPPSGSTMPPMDVPAKDLDTLVTYLLTLK